LVTDLPHPILVLKPRIDGGTSPLDSYICYLA
jgi:hypothetical protein